MQGKETFLSSHKIDILRELSKYSKTILNNSVFLKSTSQFF